MMLSEYMTKHGVTDEALGLRAGLSRSAVSRIRRGLSDPPASTLQRLVQATGGEVSFAEMAASLPIRRPAEPMRVSA